MCDVTHRLIIGWRCRRFRRVGALECLFVCMNFCPKPPIHTRTHICLFNCIYYHPQPPFHTRTHGPANTILIGRRCCGLSHVCACMYACMYQYTLPRPPHTPTHTLSHVHAPANTIIVGRRCCRLSCCDFLPRRWRCFLLCQRERERERVCVCVCVGMCVCVCVK